MGAPAQAGRHRTAGRQRSPVVVRVELMAAPLASRPRYSRLWFSQPSLASMFRHPNLNSYACPMTVAGAPKAN